jgi:A/G-specific adenine glycosylase
MLPWRGDDLVTYGKTPERSAYGVWVSEVMLQQTQVATVIPYWMKWMENFPDVGALAAASPNDVNALWAGLGYYRRCQFLLKGAKMVVDELGGVLPDTPAALLKIPGIGPYTAGAISSIYYGLNSPIVDGNVIRVFSRLQALEAEVGPSLDRFCWKLADQLVKDVDRPDAFNQGLMELGATVCTPKNPTCGKCPLSTHCAARRNEDAAVTAASVPDIESLGDAGTSVRVTSYPRKPIKKRQREVLLNVGVFEMLPSPTPSDSSDGGETREGLNEETSTSIDVKYLFVRRPKDGLLANQWEFPSVTLWEESAQDVKETNSSPKVTSNAPSFSNKQLWNTMDSYLHNVLDFNHVSTLAPDDEWIAASISSPGRRFMQVRAKQRCESVQHLFTHQKHTMMVTSFQVQHGSWGKGEGGEECPLAWQTVCGSSLEVKWMSAKEIRAAGITTGMDKVLKMVMAPAVVPKAKAVPTKKRKTPPAKAVLSKDQPKMSSFFTTKMKKEET